MTYKPIHYQVNGISYTNKYTYVDIDTGEIIQPDKAKDKTKYITIKTTKNETTGTGAFRTVNLTRECRKQPQTRLFD